MLEEVEKTEFENSFNEDKKSYNEKIKMYINERLLSQYILAIQFRTLLGNLSDE